MNPTLPGPRSKVQWSADRGLVFVERTLEFVLPGDLATRTGGYAYDRAIIAGLRSLGWRVSVHELEDSFPFPTADALADARSVFAALPDQALVVVDGLAFGAMPGIAESMASRLRLVGLVHHPLALESGLEDHQRLELQFGERRALSAARAVIVTSKATAAGLRDYDVPAARITVIEPGTVSAPVAAGSGSTTLSLLCVASLSTRKGHDILFLALSNLAGHDWHLTCVGGEPQTGNVLHRMQAQLESYGIADRVTFAGTGDDESVASAYAVADVFVLPTRYEGYGMVVAEALARGLPVVSTRTGAIPELVGEHAGLVVPTNDVNALAAALERLFVEPALLPRLRQGALAGRERLPRWEDSCARLSRLLERVI